MNVDSKKKKSKKKTKSKKVRPELIAQTFENFSDYLNDWDSSLSRFADRTSIEMFESQKTSPVFWAADSEDLQQLDWIQACFTLCHKGVTSKRKKRLAPTEELAESTLPRLLEPVSELPDAILSLSTAYALREIALALEPSQWNSTCVALQEKSENSVLDCPLLSQLITCEMSVVLGTLFPEIQTANKWVQRGIANMQSLIGELVDGNGMIMAKYLPILGPLLASWTRMITLIDEFGIEEFDSEYRHQFEWVLRQTLRLIRTDGSIIFSGQASSATLSMLQCAAKISNDSDDTEILSVIFPKAKKSRTKTASAKKVKKAKKPKTTGRSAKTSSLILPELSGHSEWAQWSIMQSDWRPQRSKVAISFHDRLCQLDLCRKQSLISGLMQPQILLDGELQHPTQNYHELCWHSDDDVDYLELELEYDSGLKIQRQFLLAREENFVYFADAILDLKESKIDYELEFDLCEGVTVEPQKETNELMLWCGDDRYAFMPLPMPEWQSARSSVAVEVQESQTGKSLKYSQSSTGSRMYCASLIDLDGSRSIYPLTWRPLTIAENLKNVAGDVAAGFRVRAGNSHWLFYRSLTDPVCRTILGQNFSCEFYAGTFDSDGTTTELLSIG